MERLPLEKEMIWGRVSRTETYDIVSREKF